MRSTTTQHTLKTSSFFAKFILFLGILFGSFYQLKAQSVANYVVSRQTGVTFVPVSGSASTFTWKNGTNRDDNLSNSAPIGFSFYYNGTVYTQFNASTNGFLNFNTATPATGGGGGAYGFVESQTFSPTGSNSIIAPCYDDLQLPTTGTLTGATSSIKYETIGLTPNRILTVQWLGLERFAATAGDLNFQVKLYEIDGRLEINYGVMIPGPSTFSYLSGINARTISVIPTPQELLVQQSTNTDVFNNTIPPSLTVLPEANSRIVFSPEPITPTAPTTFSTAAVTQSNTDVRWIDNSTTENYFIVSRSTNVGGPFTQVGTVNTATKPNIGTQYSFSNTGLLPSTIYYYRITANSEGRPPSAFLAGSQLTLAPGIVNSITSGNWSAPSTWSTGVVPISTDEVNIINGHTVTIDIAAVAFRVNVGGATAGNLIYLSTSAQSLTVGGDVDIKTNGTFRSAATGTILTHSLNIGRTLKNAGILDFSTNGNSAGAGIIFNTTVNGTFELVLGSNTNLKSAAGVRVDKGSSSVAQLSFIPNGTLTVQGANSLGFLTLVNGTFEIAQSLNIPFSNPVFSVAGYSIPATATFWMNNSNGTVVAQNGNVSNIGTIRISDGTLNIGSAVGNIIAGTNGNYIISGGVVNIAGRLSIAGTGSFIQDKGDLNITTLLGGNTTTSFGGFDMSVNTFFNVSGGAINLVNPSTASTPIDYRILSSTVDITGGVLNVGTPASALAANFRISGSSPEIILLSGRSAILVGNFSVFGNTFIQFPLATTLNLNGFTFFQRGSNITNRGTLIGTTGNSVLHFLDTKVQTFSGDGIVSPGLITLSMDNPLGLTITHANQIVVLRVNLFQGNISGSNRITLGNGVNPAATQIGSPGLTLTGGSYVNSPLFNIVGSTYTVLYSQEGSLRTTGFEIPASRIITNATINNLNGVTLNGGLLTLSGILTFSNGRLNTSSLNLLTISNTAVGAILTPSASSYVNGPLARVLPSSLGLGSTYVFPVGKATYNPIEYLDATTNALGTVTIQSEVFDAASGGTAGANIGALNTNRYWTSFVNLGVANLLGTRLRFTDANKASADIIGGSVTLLGAYDSQGGLTSTITATTIATTPPVLTSFPGFYQLGSKSVVVLSSLTISPVGNQCVNVARTVTVNTSPNPASVIIEYFVNGVAQANIPMSLSGSTWTGIIPVVSPVNANVVWNIKSIDGAGFTKTLDGITYSDDPLFTVNVVASSTPVSLCAGSPTSLSVAVSGGKDPAIYAVSNTTNPLTNEDLVNVTLSQGGTDIINNTTIINTLSGTIGTATGIGGGYSNFTSFGPYGVTSGQSYDFSLESATANTVNFDNRLGILIDYNRDGDFLDVGEVVVNGASLSGPHLEQGSFIIPATALNGLTRMRVISNGSFINIIGSTGIPSIFEGEIEDYLLNISSPNNGGGAPPVVTNYAWSDGVGPVGTNSATISISPSVSTNYTVTITSAGCTKISNLVAVTVNPVPSVPTAAGSSHCGSQIPTASVTSTSGLPSPIFRWYTAATGGTLLQTNTSTTYLTAIATTTTFHVSEANAGGCESSTRVPVTVSVLASDPLFAASSTPTACPGASFNLTPTKTGSSNTFTLTWSAVPAVGSGIPTPVSGTLNTALVITPTINGTYVYTITGVDGGCTSVASVTVTVADPFAGVTKTVSVFPNPVCAGTNTDLTLSLSGGPIPPTYAASSATSVNDEDIGNVTITQGASTILNNTTPVSSLIGTIGTATGTAARYSNFTAFGPYGLAANGTYDFSLTSVQTGINFGHRFAIYIDYNRNGSFTDAGEEIYNSAVLTSGPHTETGSFTVPAAIFNGIARMRVITNEGTISGSTTTFIFGEVEDYNVLLSGGTTGGGSSGPVTAYSWFDGVSIVGTSNPQTVTPSGPTTYTVTATIGGCTTTESILVTPTVVAGSITSTSSSMCLGGSTSVTVALSGPGPWAGQIRSGTYFFPFSTATTPFTITGVLAPVTGTFIFNNLFGAAGCAALPANLTGSHFVTVNPLPTASITGASTVCPSATVILTATVNPQAPATVTGYQWKLNGVDIGGATLSTYTTGVLGNYTVEVTNSNNCKIISAVFPLSIQQYNVTASSTGNGNISPTTATPINCESGTINYTFTPNVCYRAIEVRLNGTPIPGFVIGSLTYALTNVTSNSTFQVVYGLIPYTINISPATVNGTITFAGGSGVDCGGTKVATITPNTCYQITSLIVNGNPQPISNTFTFTNVTSNQTITANFTLVNFNIVSSVNGVGGTISPLGTTSVGCNLNQIYTITPDLGFSVLDVLVNGVSVGPVLTYTFTNVTTTHTIEAFFNDTSCVNPPTANAGLTDTICSNQVFTLGGVIGGSATAGTWSTSGTGTFNGGAVFGTATTYTPSVADITAGFRTITLTSNNPAGAPCVAAASSFILRFDLVPTAGITGILNYCIASNTVLSSNATAGSGAIVLYEWFRGATPVGGNTANLTASVAGSYTVRVSNSNGCSFTSGAVGVVQNVSPTVSIAVDCNPVFPGNTANFTAIATLGSGSSITTYQWVLNGITNVGPNAATFATTIAGSYTCIVTNNQTCTATSNTIILNPVTGPLNGTYTVGSPGCSNFNTLAIAATYLNNNGVSGPVIINLASAYAETAPVGGYLIGSAILNPTLNITNTLTIRKASGTNPTITAYVGTGTVASALPDGIFKLLGVDYVTIRDLNLNESAGNTTTTTWMEFGIGLFKLNNDDGAQNNLITNNVITLNRNNFTTANPLGADGSAGILMYNSTFNAAFTSLVSPTLAAGRNSNNRFYSNTIQNTHMGIVLSGFTDVSPFTFADTGNDIGGSSLATGNTIINFGGGSATILPASGIKLRQQYSINASFNTINNNLSSGGVDHLNTLRGIWGESGDNANATINNNNINLSLATTAASGSLFSGIENAIGANGTNNIVSISNNTISGMSYAGTTNTIGVVNGITLSFLSTYFQYNINNNSINAISISSGGLITGIRSAISPSSLSTINTNTISGITRTSSVNGIINGIIANTSINGLSISSNTIENVGFSNVDNTGAIEIITTQANSVGGTFSNNIIRNISSPRGQIRGIVEQSNTGTKIISGNQVYNFSTFPIGGTGLGAFTGILSNGGTIEVSNNQVYGLNRTSTGAIAVNVIGISIAGSTQQLGQIFNNKIYELSFNGTSSTSIVTGLSLTNNFVLSVNNIYNNRIAGLTSSLSSNANAVIGISNTLTTVQNTLNIFYNTVVITNSNNVSGSGSSAISVVTAPTLNMKNNIFINKPTIGTGTGFNSAFRRSTTTIATYLDESDHNLFFASGPKAAFYFDGTNNELTLSDFKTRMVIRDQVSVSEDVNFLSTIGSSADFLKVNTTIISVAEGGGIPVSGINDDFEGDIRQGSGGYVGTGFAPDIGADEFAGINNGPRITAVSITPSNNQCIATARTITASITTARLNPSSYLVRYRFGALAPVDAIMTGSNPYTATIPAAVPSNALVTWTIVATNSFNITSSLEGTSYQDNPNGNYSSVSTKATGIVECQGNSFVINNVATLTTLIPDYTLNPNPPLTGGFNNEDIGSINFGSQLSNTSTVNILTGGTIGNASGLGGTFSNYVAFPIATPYIAGTSYSLNVTPVLGPPTLTQTNYLGVFIDYNRNGLFTDPGEFVFSSAPNSGTSLISTSITIADNIIPGRTRIRFILKALSPVTSPTEGFANGETEDYNIEIVNNFTYSWSDGVGVVGTTENLTTTAVIGRSYTLTATDQNGCTLVSNTVTPGINPTGTWVGGGTLNVWNDAANWCGGIPVSTTNAVITGTAFPVVSTADAAVNTLTINSSARLNIITGRRMLITNNGNITNQSPTPAIGLGEVVFNGVGAVIGNTTFQNLTINGGLTLPTGVTVNGTFRLNSGGFLAGLNGPTYGNSSLLLYNQGGAFNRTVEWGANAAGPGYPNDVQISNNTQLNLGAGSAAGKTTLNGTQRNLTIDGGGSSLLMDFGTGNNQMTVPLTINGDLLINGFLSLSNAGGGDLRLRGNLTLNGTWNPYTRAVFVTSNGAQNFTSSTPPLVIPYLIYAPVSGSVNVVMNSDLRISGNAGGSGLQFSNAGDRLNINGRNLQLGTFGNECNVFGLGAFTGSLTSEVLIQGNGSGSNINFRMDPLNKLSKTLSRFIIERGGNPSVTLTDSLRIEADDLVPNSGTVYLNFGTLATGNRLVLGSKINGTARLDDFFSGADITGQIVAERYINGGITLGNRRFRHLSSPVNEGAGTISFNQLFDDIHITGVGGTGSGFDAGNGLNRPSVFMYNEPVNDNLATLADRQKGYVGISNVSNTIATGRGFLALVRGPRLTQVNPFSGISIPDPTTIDYIGTANRGNIDCFASFTNQGAAGTPTFYEQFDGFNLVGNPYPSQINPGPIMLSNPNLLKTTQTYNMQTGNYEFWNYTTGIGSSNAQPTIASGQGFLIQALSTTNLSLTESSKTANTTYGNYFRSASIPNLLRVKLVLDVANSDETIVVFQSGAHKYYEPFNDAMKFFGSSVNLTTRSTDNLQLAINMYPETVSTDTIPMPISSSVQTNHKFVFSGLESFDPNVNLYLLDNFLNTTTAIGNNYEHTFLITADPNSQGLNRFKLIFDTQGALPVNLSSFDGRKKEMTSLLTWKAASISGKPVFEIERSLDGKSFTKIGEVKSNSGFVYSFTDLKPELTINYYRLRILDNNGKSENSKVIALDFSDGATKMAISVFPNPFSDNITVKLKGVAQERYALNIIDGFGRKLKSTLAFPMNNEINVSLSDLSAGMYTLELRDTTNGELIAKEKIVKQ